MKKKLGKHHGGLNPQNEEGSFHLQCRIAVLFDDGCSAESVYEFKEILLHNLQALNFAYIRLLNKPYENEVTLTRQNMLPAS